MKSGTERSHLPVYKRRKHKYKTANDSGANNDQLFLFANVASIARL